MQVELNVYIKHSDTNFWVIKPKEQFIKAIEEEIQEYESILMKVNNLGHGGNCVAISFGGERHGPAWDNDMDEKGDSFGFIVDKETLKEITDGLTFVLENYDL